MWYVNFARGTEVENAAGVRATPFKHLHGEDYSGVLVPFGSRVVYKLDDTERDKFQSRGVDGIAVGVGRVGGVRPARSQWAVHAGHGA